MFTAAAGAGPGFPEAMIEEIEAIKEEAERRRAKWLGEAETAD